MDSQELIPYQMSPVLSVQSIDHSSHFCIHVAYSSALLIVDFILASDVLTSYPRSIGSKSRYDLSRRMSGWLKTPTLFIWRARSTFERDTHIAVQPGVTVHATTRPAQRKGVWPGVCAVPQSRRGYVRAPAAQNRGVPC